MMPPVFKIICVAVLCLVTLSLWLPAAVVADKPVMWLQSGGRVAENPNALVASYRIPAGTMPGVANRIKMARTSNVIVVVEAGGKLYSTSKEVKVTVGGCGG